MGLLPFGKPKSVASLVVTLRKLLEHAVGAVDGGQQEAVEFATAVIMAACGAACQGIKWRETCAQGAPGNGGGGGCGDPSTAASSAPAAPAGVPGDNGRGNSGSSSSSVEVWKASSSSSASSCSAATACTQAAAYAQLQTMTTFAAAELLPCMLRLSAAVRTLAASSRTPVPAAGIMAAVSPAVVVVVWEVTAAVRGSRAAGGEGADGAAAAPAGSSCASGAARGDAGCSWSGLLFPPGVKCELVSLLGINLLGLETVHAGDMAAGQGACLAEVVSVCAQLAEAFPAQVRPAVERRGGNNGGRAWSPRVMLRLAGRARNRGDLHAAEDAEWLARKLAGWGVAVAGEGRGGRGGPGGRDSQRGAGPERATPLPGGLRRSCLPCAAARLWRLCQPGWGQRGGAAAGTPAVCGVRGGVVLQPGVPGGALAGGAWDSVRGAGAGGRRRGGAADGLGPRRSWVVRPL